MKKAVVLFLALLTLTGISSCQTPGMEEPDIFICSIIDDKSMSCVNSLDNNIRKEVLLLDSIGFMCVDPDAYSKAKVHHRVLHRTLNKCESDKK